MIYKEFLYVISLVTLALLNVVLFITPIFKPETKA